MATEWAQEIVTCDLSDEPQLSEELQDLHAKLAERSPGEVPDAVLDLSNITYLNSSNIAQMLRVRKVLVESDRKLKLSGVSDAVWSIMLLTGLDKVFEFSPDKATAIASLKTDAQ